MGKDEVRRMKVAIGHDIDCLPRMLLPMASVQPLHAVRFYLGIEILNVPNQITISISTEMKAPRLHTRTRRQAARFTTDHLPKR
jgi:siroheme synthase (precorrin-2 oxidase/ferrochelatase)